MYQDFLWRFYCVNSRNHLMGKSVLATLLMLGFLNPVSAQTYGTGLVLLPADEYQSLPATPRFREFLPPSADLSNWFPDVGNQGQQSSCTAWSTTYYMRSYYENRKSLTQTRSVSLSPAFVYNQLASLKQQCGEGLQISKALQFLKTKGAPPATSFPYQPNSCVTQPDNEVLRLAGNYRIVDWKRLDKGKLDDVKGALAAGNPVVIAMLLPPSFVSFKGAKNYDDITRTEDAHAMAVVGYDDSRLAFRLINSWGTSWGDKGYAWVSYRTFEATVVEAYVARVAVVPPPAPLPTPPAPPKPVAVIEIPVPKPVPVPAPVPDLLPQPQPQPILIKPPKPNLKQIEQNIIAIAKDFRCANVQTNLTGGRLMLSGFAGEQSDIVKLQDVLASAGESIKLNVQHRPWPQCEALLTLADPLQNSMGLSISTSKTDLLEGESLSFQITTPNYASYLYVSYIQADGQVIHLRRYADQANVPIAAGTRLVLGAKGEYLVSGPVYGQESLVVIASALPLLAFDRPPTESEREYLTEFRLAILSQQKAKEKVSASLLTLTTKNR